MSAPRNVSALGPWFAALRALGLVPYLVARLLVLTLAALFVYCVVFVGQPRSDA